MKKNFIYLFALICSMSLFVACSDKDEPEVPPTVEDVIAEYSADNLKPTIEGADVSLENVKIELAKTDTKDKVTIILSNVVPGVAEFRIPDAEFAATTRSLYISTLKGEATDNVAGYNVKIDGTVDNKILTVKIVLTAIAAENINTKDLRGLVYKGKMGINVSNIAEPISMEQRVYISAARSSGMAKRDTSMVKLQIKNFAFQGLELGTITLDTILVQKRADVMILKGVSRKINVDKIGEVLAELNGSIVGGKIDLNLNIDAAGLKVGVAFNGDPVKELQKVSMEEMKVEGAAIVGTTSTTSSLTLQVWENTEASKLLLTPKYKLSEKAVIDSVVLVRKGEPNVKLSQDQISGKAPIDFSVLKQGKSDYIKYFLAAEDPNTKGSYIIYVERFPVVNTNFTFDKWVGRDPEGWATSNQAADFFPAFKIDVPTPVLQVASENAAKITTSRTVSTISPNGMIPGVTAGTLFLGAFKIDISNTLKSTKFGIPFSTKPVTFKVTYKYIPGTTFYKTVTKESVNDTEVVAGENDKCSISAYLYEVANYSETLDGSNINTSDKVILKATTIDGSTNGSYKDMTIQFASTGKGTFDANKKYKLAVVCSSSDRGDLFMGADGSQLFVKKLVIE